MTTAKLSTLQTLNDVARACGVDADLIAEYSQSSTQRNFYRALKIPKRGKGRSSEYRVVFATTKGELKGLHRSISMIVLNSVSFANHVQGFIKRRSIRTNASQHLGAKVLLHADIKDFFDSITVAQVRNALLAHGASVLIADLLAETSTIDGLLRQGTRCSPTIANLVCLELDAALLRIASSINANYTRYADNITFSGDVVPTDDAIKEVLKSYGFKLRKDSCIRQYRGRSQFVTGLTVSDPQSPRLPKRLKRQLRLIMHYIEKYGMADHCRSQGVDSYELRSWLWGMFKYAHSIEPVLVKPWQEILDNDTSEYRPHDLD